MPIVVLLRHGESEWNLKNQFTGWANPPLTPKGKAEARLAGKLLKAFGITFDKAWTSTLDRADSTAKIVLPEMGQGALYEDITRDDDLRERNYGNILTGMNKDEAIDIFGADAVYDFRRGYYAELPSKEGDVSGKDWENLHHVVQRIWPRYNMDMRPHLEKGQNIIIVAHGNINRGFIKKICDETPESIEKIEPGTAIPVILELDNMLICQKRYYLKPEESRGAPVMEPF